MRTRDDPFDLAIANFKFFENICCKRLVNFDLMSRHGFNLISLGGSELYSKQHGVQQPGFGRSNSFLCRWDIPVSSFVYQYGVSLRQKNLRFKERLYGKKSKREGRTHETQNRSTYASRIPARGNCGLYNSPKVLSQSIYSVFCVIRISW